jgi:tetratricopeptide (TPR) repeat protein
LVDAYGSDPRALEFAERLVRARDGDPLRLADALRRLASACMRSGRIEEAASAIRDAEAAGRSLEPAEVAEVLATIARFWAGYGDERAIRYAEECVDIRVASGDRPQLAVALEMLADVFERLGHPAEARSALERRLTLGETRRDLQLRLDELGMNQLIATWNADEVRLYPYSVTVGARTVPLAALASIAVVDGSWRKLPRVTLELWDGERVEFEIRAAATVNFVANNRAAADFKSQVTARQGFT